ncbi:MAG: radical SAM protein [Acidobacteriota bacterium]|nr:radical SAM protein [Acidobacteriota bacterium]
MSRKNHLLLLNPWAYDFTAYNFWLRPLGLLYLAGIIKQNTDFDLDFIDCLDCSQIDGAYHFRPRERVDGRSSFFREEVSKPELFRHIPRKFCRYGLPYNQVESILEQVPPPVAVLLTCTLTYWYPGVQVAVELIRKKFGGVPIILGGVYATLCADHARSQSGADVVLTGPGENQILLALKEITGRDQVKAVDDLPVFPDFDSLPSPAYELSHNTSVLALMTSRGCPFHCTYCASRLLCQQFEQRNPEKVVAEIMHFWRTLGTEQIAFYDDALLINKDRHLIKILEALARLKPGLRFHTPNGLHPREIDPVLARWLKACGFDSLFLSLESSNTAWLAETGAKVKPEEVARALNYLKEAGFKESQISVYLLVGLPGQDKKQVIDSIEFIRSLGARPRLAYFSPVPGTADWSRLLSSGHLKSDSDPLLQNKLAFAYFWSQFTPEDLDEIKKKAAGKNEG